MSDWSDPGDWFLAIASWLTALQAAGRPATTIGLRRYHLERLAAELAHRGPFTVTADDLLTWFGSQTFGVEYRRSWRSSIRSFYRWAHGSGRMAHDPALALPAIKPKPPMPHPAPEDAYRDALACADVRTRLMLRLAAELGMRRGEVARVHSRDIERALDGWSLVVHGKGGKLRRLPIGDLMAATIRNAKGYVFPGAIDGHLSPHYVGKLVARALPGVWSMHSLRHRFATVAYSVDRDLVTVQEALGHSSPVTTRRYVAIPPEALRRTIAAVVAAS